MDIAIIISVISGLFVLINSVALYFIHKQQNTANIKKTLAETINLEVKTARELIDELRHTVEDHREKIQLLVKEIDQLKNREEIHKLEKMRLEEKIQDLSTENEALRKQVTINQTEYNIQIDKLKDQINVLRTALNKYTNEHP